MRTLYVVIGCDTDPDRPGFLAGTKSDGLSWRGMTEGIPCLKKLVRGLTDHQGKEPVFTWLLRVDEQVNRILGAYNWVLVEHKDFLLDLESRGDELGWHPHFWAWDEHSRTWYQEISNIDWQIDMLKAAHRAYMEILPGRARSVRMGWDYHNNDTFRVLGELGVRVDFSAVPGLRTLTSRSPACRENLFDWYPTPLVPYYPSQKDYRRPPREEEEACAVLEAPAFVSQTLLWGMVSGLHMARKMKDLRQLWQSLRRPTFWINLTGRPSLFAPLVSRLRKTLRRKDREKALLVTYFHADELLEHRSTMYGLPSVRTNLESILRVSDEAGVTVEFIRAERIAEVFP